MTSPLDFLTDAKWKSLCAKYNVKQSFKPRRLGSGVSATAYTFGTKLVIKETRCSNTIGIARKLKNKDLSMVAKVYEIGVARKCGEAQYGYGGSTKYYIIQEMVKKRRSEKARLFCDNFSDFARSIEDLGDMRTVNSFIDMVFQLKRCGIDIGEISDLHDDNVFATKNGGVKIVDLGCLDFG